MDLSQGGFVSPNGHYNTTIADAQAFLQTVRDAKYQGTFLAAVPQGETNMGLIVPQNQADAQETNAVNLDTSNDFSGTPDNVPLSLHVYVDSDPNGQARETYFNVGLCKYDMETMGKTLDQVLAVQS